jgi:hypothetical protein
MATTMRGAKQSGYVPRKVAREIKKRAVEKRKAKREKKAKEKEKKDVSAKWQGACVPPDLRRPWIVFHEDVLYSLEEGNDLSRKALLAFREDLHAVQELGALRAFQALPACRQRAYAKVSLQEVSAFAAWSATCGLADPMERIAAWTGLDADDKADHVPRNWRALLAKDPTWHVLIADDVKEEEEEHQEREGAGKRARRWARRTLVAAEPSADKENGADEKTNSLLAADGDVSSWQRRVVLHRGRVVIATRTRGGGRKSTQGAADDDKKSSSIKPIRKRPACASSRPRENPAVTARPALGEASGVSPAAGTSTAVAGRMGRPRGQRRVDALEAKYPWGREGGPPPASEAELQSLANQMARLRKEKGNFGRPEKADAERHARAEAMLHIMRGKARAGFGGGRAMATHGLSLNRSAGLALAKRARKLALVLEKHFDPKAAPSVLIEEGIALLDAD